MSKRWIALALALILTVSLCACGKQGKQEKTTDEIIEETIANMTAEQKLAQMMIVAFRSDGSNRKTATELTPAYEELLKKYAFGGVLLFGGNIVDEEQTITLIWDCQAAAVAAKPGIPLLICVD